MNTRDALFFAGAALYLDSSAIAALLDDANVFDLVARREPTGREHFGGIDLAAARAVRRFGGSLCQLRARGRADEGPHFVALAFTRGVSQCAHRDRRRTRLAAEREQAREETATHQR